ncbi:MAG TPA: fumarylacetoacetate hydrolase family protein [Candidatus Micrarchaeia archaeon]|nr:fumarylacetoacetate hydrolase family protein [Candidatus Micrarchaeia archaeon]
MRLATIVTTGGPRVHLRTPAGYVDVATALGDERLRSVRALLEAGPDGWARLGTVAGPALDPATATVAATIPDPGKVICVGRNYLEHALEGGSPPPTWPETFLRFADSLTAPFADVVLPAFTEQLDYEGELGVVIGRGGHHIPAERAIDAIAGYVVCNDYSARDWQRAGTQWTPGKNFDNTMPVGPELVTVDEVDPADVLLETRLNGEVMQSARTSLLIFDIPSIVEYVSSFTTLRPGDVIATGTPGGVGFARTPPVYLKAGDSVEVTIEGVGMIRNRIVANDLATPPWPWKPLSKKRQPVESRMAATTGRD